MTDAQKGILASIRAELADLPEESVRRALEFYEEYFADALEAGHSEEETLERLGGIKEIVSQVRAETALAGAERSPGPFRLIGAGRQVLRGLAGTAGRFSLILGASVPYTLALCFYLTAACAFVGAPAAIALMGYGITTMSGADILAKIGAAGMGLFSAAFLCGIGMGLWAAAKGITRVTLRVLRWGLQRDRHENRQPEKSPPRTGKLKTAFLVCAVAAVAGLGATLPSGLPMKCFSIWNGMKPANLAIREWSFPPAGIRELEFVTMNSGIILETAAVSQDAIRVTYEEPEWLTGIPVASDGKLTFREVSTGAIPFMDFIARHPGTTSVKIVVPRGFRAGAAALASGSGDLSLVPLADTMRADTVTGNIRFDAGEARYRIDANTRKGRIIVDGETRQGSAYETGGTEGVAELKSEEGTIEIR